MAPRCPVAGRPPESLAAVELQREYPHRIPVAITQWAWAEFREQLGAKKVAGKTLERLKKLIWLAAQDVKAELAGKDVYQHQDTAALCGVKPDNWCHNYADYWRAMCAIFKRLDDDSLRCTVRTRSQQKATFSKQGIAKVN